jgi:SAM-dependent methyltransferase
MKVVVLGAGTGDVALLVAERVGASGAVLGVDDDPERIADARRRAREQRFEQVRLSAQRLDAVAVDGPFDAVFGAFSLMRESDPVGAIRTAAGLVRIGGRVVFAEWHFESMLWGLTSSWPELPAYARFARWTVAALRCSGAHADMGLRLVNGFVEAGLPLPHVRTALRAVDGHCAAGFGFFAETLREQLPVLERVGILSSEDAQVEPLIEQMRSEALASGGHAFLPLLAGAWTIKPGAPG